MLKSPNLQFLPFAYHLPNSISNPLWSISDLKVICARSWGDIEAIGDLRSPKTSSQQPRFWGRMRKNTLYFNVVINRKCILWPFSNIIQIYTIPSLLMFSQIHPNIFLVFLSQLNEVVDSAQILLPPLPTFAYFSSHIQLEQWFSAPTGALGVTISVCPSVCLSVRLLQSANKVSKSSSL